MSENNRITGFTPEVTALVNNTIRNESGIEKLKPYLARDFKEDPLFKPYDYSEFYQLRIACSLGSAPEVLEAANISRNQTGRACDLVLIKAADNMREKKVPITDPTHLLAPYHIAQTSRGYGPVDGTAENNAILGADFSAQIHRGTKDGPYASITQSAADDLGVRINLRPLFPTNMPKESPGIPVTLRSTKGGAKDAAFTVAAAKSILNNMSTYIPATSAGISPLVYQVIDAQGCSTLGTQLTRNDCARNGFQLFNEYRLRR